MPDVKYDYFDWLSRLVCDEYQRYNYECLLSQLNDIPFKWNMMMDGNRAADGVDMRTRYMFAYDLKDEVLDILAGPCSVLEMMVALSCRIERDIMHDPRLGDRKSFWFWNMLLSMGLHNQSDDEYNPDYVLCKVLNMMEHHFDYDGKGGLFWLPRSSKDMTKLQIWDQMQLYLRDKN